jgi:CheY-like chemotaxis protein
MNSPPLPPSVLVVEDEPLVRMIAAEALSAEGIPALEAGDGATALDLLEAHSEVAVLFTDFDMPGMDGAELGRRARELRPALEVIVTSGKRRLLDLSLPDHGTFLPKPYGLNTLIELVRSKLGAAGSVRRA